MVGPIWPIEMPIEMFRGRTHSSFPVKSTVYPSLQFVVASQNKWYLLWLWHTELSTVQVVSYAALGCDSICLIILLLILKILSLYVVMTLRSTIGHSVSFFYFILFLHGKMVISCLFCSQFIAIFHGLPPTALALVGLILCSVDSSTVHHC